MKMKVVAIQVANESDVLNDVVLISAHNIKNISTLPSDHIYPIKRTMLFQYPK